MSNWPPQLHLKKPEKEQMKPKGNRRKETMMTKVKISEVEKKNSRGRKWSQCLAL
jgi:hypothetical protein